MRLPRLASVRLPRAEHLLAAALATILVIDGDTVEQAGVRWRLYGIDAPEIHRARCPAERQAGILAAARLIGLLKAQGGRLEAVPGRRDKYGRQVGRLLLGDGRDWAAISVAEGHAVAGDRRHDFCR